MDTEVEKLLTNPRKKWVYLEAENVYHERIATWYMHFNKDNTCDNRYLSDGSKYIFIDGPEEKCKWYYDKKRKIVDICGQKFYVTKYVSDTIYLTHLENHNKYWFVNFKNNSIVKKS